MAGFQTPQQKVASKQRQAQAIELRKAGATYKQIMEALGYGSISAAEKAVSSGLKALVREPAEELRTLLLEQHRALLKAIWPTALRGNLPSIDRALRILAAIADLEGANAPKRVNVEMIVQTAANELGLTDEERAALMTDVEQFMANQRGAIL